jgi:ABC-type multidrug transport system ATPase subunit
VWDRINAKGSRGCVLVLTTHYMEEADALAQRVGIMVNGMLKVLGSPQHLKSVHGGGYRIELKGPEETSAQAAQLVSRLFPGVKLLEAHGGFQVFEMASATGSGGTRTATAGAAAPFRLGPVFQALDKAKSDLKLERYSLSQTTLEQVFLNIAEQQEEDDDDGHGAAVPTASAR